MINEKEFQWFKNTRKGKKLKLQDKHYLEDCEYMKKYADLVEEFDNKINKLESSYNINYFMLNSFIKEKIREKECNREIEMIIGTMFTLLSVLLIMGAGIINVVTHLPSLGFLLVGIIFLIFGIKNTIQLKKLK